jgi:hypothetical protein
MRKLFVLIIALTFNISAQDISGMNIPLSHSSESFNISNIDSLSENYRTHYSGINVIAQIVAGEIMAIGFSVVPFAAAFGASLSERSGESEVNFWTAVAISAYAFGTATGVHLIAKIENKDHSFGKTVLYSEFGALLASGFAIALKSDKRDNAFSSKQAGVLILILPMVSSLVYSLALADWPEQSTTVTKYKVSEMNNKILSFKDLVNQSQIIKINLFRISL